MPEGELLFSGVENDSSTEAVSGPIGYVALAPEILAAHSLSGLDRGLQYSLLTVAL